jgi:hypothetical protein
MDSGGVQEGWSALHRLLKKRLKPFNHLPVQHPENCRNPWSSDELGLAHPTGTYSTRLRQNRFEGQLNIGHHYFGSASHLNGPEHDFAGR